MRKEKFNIIVIRALLCLMCLMPARMWAVGWIPSEAGLVVNLETGERFLLSVWIDVDGDGVEDPGEEYFVYNYNRGKRPDDIFDYATGLYLKLFPQAPDATEPSEMSVWSAGAPVPRVIGGKDYSLGVKAGQVYTIWNDGKTLKTKKLDGGASNFQFYGDLASSYEDKDACDVVFMIPTVRGKPDVTRSPGPNPTSFDSGNTLGKGTAPFDGRIGTGFLGMTYREVFMFYIPRENPPKSYTNAALVTFNTTQSTWKLSSGAGNITKGHAAYAFADKKHDPTPRTLFRLYLLDKPFVSCPSTYFFATDEQDYVKYRKTENIPGKNASDSTSARKIYTMDYLTRMDRDGSTTKHQTGYMYVPVPDSTYYYVGYNNDYYAAPRDATPTPKMGTEGAYSQFTKIRELPLATMPEFKAPAGAYGRMVLDSTSTADNHAVAFEPKGYMLKVNTGTNVRMIETGDHEWTTQDMWTINAKWLGLKIKATVMTGSEFSESDPGADIIGWSDSILGSAVPVDGGGFVTEDMYGYARIYTNNSSKNGGMKFFPANTALRLSYDNNGFLGVEIPDQYPLGEGTTVIVQAPRLKTGYTFLGWSTTPKGDVEYAKGEEIDLGEILKDSVAVDGTKTLTLYAQATYNGTLQMAISFIHPTDKKRYFLTQPSTATPRFARARHFDSWENTWQGMVDAENSDPNYLSTYELRCPVKEIKKKGEGVIDDLYLKEHVLDPRRDTMKGYVDSLIFYEDFAPNKDEYLGLYYDRSMNTILANKTWAGLFTTTSDATELSWPNYQVPYIDSTKIQSSRYVEEYDSKNKPDSLILKNRKDGTGWLPAFVQYDPATDQFNGTALEKDGTDFQITAVIVADAHYIVLPDTAYDWRDTIEFDYHKGEQIREDVWSSLIGKQLMAVMVVDGDTVYFHPNRKKIINDPNDLYLSSDFRVTQLFDLIHDSRVSAPLNEGDSAQAETTDYYWHRQIVSGMNSPMNVKDGSGNYIDIVDTFRLTLSHDAISKIKEYRGRWNKDATGLTVDNRSGSVRHRDVIVRTKTYHYGDTLRRLELVPDKESYNFSPLAGQSQQLNFKLRFITSRQLLDVKGKAMEEEILSVKDTTSLLSLVAADCSLAHDDDFFTIGTVASNHVTLTTKEENTMGVNYDTLKVSKTIRIDGKDYTAKADVLLAQAALTTSELVWSVYDESTKRRYFIMAVSDGSTTTLQFREFTHVGSMLYKEGTKTQLEIGSNAGNNSDGKYLTPWTFAYYSSDHNQLSLETKYSINRYFAISGETGTLAAEAADPVYFTFRIAEVHTNANSNYEEKVRIKYGAGEKKWLKFNGGATPSITLQADSATATEFSWTYLNSEYNLLNNGTYPSDDIATFGRNVADPKAIQTRYKAYRENSMLLDDELTYLCHVEEEDIADLIDKDQDWKTYYTITRKADGRTFDSGYSTNLSGLTIDTDDETLITTITATGLSPTDVKIGGKYVNIVDTLVFTLRDSCHYAYRFQGDWTEFKSISDADLKIPLVRKTYHTGSFSTLSCAVEGDDDNYTFPATITSSNDTHDYVLRTILREGTQALDVDNEVIAVLSERYIDVTKDRLPDTVGMHLNNKLLAEVRLMDVYGNTPDWCEIDTITSDTITVRCTDDGIRSPRTAYLYLAYIVTLNGTARFVNYRLTVSQASYFEYANNQVLVHTSGASGDEMMENGMQQVHTNKRILYYYPDQDVELPVRERAFYGWWRWYREGYDVDSVDVSDTDVPDSLWRTRPMNTGKYNFPFRTIGDSVWVDESDHDKGKKLVTMGRWTVFHYKSKDYNNKQDPPAKSPRVAPPDTMRVGTDRGKYPVVTYAVDISNYYDNLPMSLKDKNQVDVALMDTMREIIEPTLSLREVFELHPWTEMAERLESYKDPVASPGTNLNYMEDHVMMAPRENALLLSTEQRYNYQHLSNNGHSESLLGYYMRDDNWGTDGWDEKDEEGWSRQDSMIWCGGWDADCQWYFYDPGENTYTLCTYPVSEEEDFLKVPSRKGGADTIYYCLRARSWKTTFPDDNLEDEIVDKEVTVEGDYWFNICRYKIIYHNANTYGPKQEVTNKGVTKAIITNDEIEQRYEVLERLDFDYIKPGANYHIYPHPLPWADASYGYTYPETSDLPHNRYHNESDFPNHGEYGLINRIPYSAYWRKMEQHGGAANGYMIYCDGMASAGQVAALTLHTNLCAGQKMFFSAYVGNPSSQTGKSNPNFIFSVQGSMNDTVWDDITSYMTGDIMPSSQWSQIFFPIIHNKGGKEYPYFRVRIYNVASSFDGNDFIIDDMCIFATKPPLIAYQANTTCKKYGEDDGETHVLLRLDYQGITGEGYNGKEVFYTVEQMTPDSVYSFVSLEDGYLKPGTAPAIEPATVDTLYGKIYIPLLDYEPKDKDSIFRNMNALLDTFETSGMAFREGYIYEILEGDIRPVKYIVHKAMMDPSNDYTVHMSGELSELMSSICGMTSRLKISNRMVLELNGEEKPEVEVLGLCANSTYDLSMKVKGSLYLDSVAPIDVEGSCINDWLLYGDTVRASSKKRYGYYYNDIIKVIKDILRYSPTGGKTSNANQFAPNLTSVSRNEMQRIMDTEGVTLETSDHPYDVLAHLVNNGFLKLYKRQMTVTVTTGDSVEYVILPIVGTGSKEVVEANVEVCPNPIYVKLKPVASSGIPLIVGGLHRDSTQLSEPVDVLLSAAAVNTSFKLRVDSIMPNVGIYSIELRSTDDPDFLPGVHILKLEPDKAYPSDGYYVKGDSITLRPAAGTNYSMKAGYNYTFNIVMQTILGRLKLDNGCEVGVVPLMLSIVPDYLRWDPKSPENNNWNEAENWVGINEHNEIIDLAAHFVPMNHTSVLIPKMEGDLPYPVLPALPLPYKDSVQKVNFQYNTCNDIRFLPEAAMSQQQRMAYVDAVADMSMPYNKWAFRAAPVKGMISGDLFRANADINGETPLWEVGEFDADGRNHNTGNTSFWLSLYSRTTIRKGNGDQSADTVRNATADWSKVTNGMNLPMPAGLGWSVYARSHVADETTVVRLPKHDDKYYYYNKSGEKMEDIYEQNLDALRTTVAGGDAGKLAFHADYEEYTITNDNSVETTSFVFGNPSMGYIDIWGFVADNCLKQEIDYIDAGGTHRTVTQTVAESGESVNNIANQERYLPPMHAMVVKLRDGQDAVNSKTFILNAYRILTEVEQKVPAIYACGVVGGDQDLAHAPRRAEASPLREGIMTVTAINPVSPRCNSRLILGQGYNEAIVQGEDAMLTTVNIDKFHMTNTPTTPFNIYAMENGYGLSIDLRDSIVNVPVSFFMSALPYDPTTELWFTGVNNINGRLVLYDALFDTERPISDGICLKIETPEANHQRRYYIRRRGFSPDGQSGEEGGITTGIGNEEQASNQTADEVYKIIRENHVYILRGGHVYTMFGQRVR